MQDFLKLINDNIIPLLTNLNYSIMLVPLLTLIWTIWNYSNNKFKPLIDNKDQKILEHILLPNFEAFEIKLYQQISAENINDFRVRFTNLVRLIRKNELFFYLGSYFTKIILEIESTLKSDTNANIDYKKLNKLFNNFSYQYDAMAWKTRRNLRIEKNYYFYKKNFNTANWNDKMNYYFSPSTFLSLFIIFGISFLTLVIAFSLIFKKSISLEMFQILLSFYVLFFCFLYMVLLIIIPTFIQLLIMIHKLLSRSNLYRKIINSIRNKKEK